MNFTYEATYEDCSPDGTVRVSAEIRITYTVNWGCPARVHYDEHDHPAEGDELEISKFEIEDTLTSLHVGGDRALKGLYWRKPTQDESDILDAWAESLREDMLLEAREAEANAEAEAKELAAEARRDISLPELSSMREDEDC